MSQRMLVGARSFLNIWVWILRYSAALEPRDIIVTTLRSMALLVTSVVSLISLGAHETFEIFRSVVPC